MQREQLDHSQEQPGSWSLVSRMRWAVLLLFLPVLLLGGLYYLHLGSVLEQRIKQDLQEENRKLRSVYVEPYLSELERQFDLIFDDLDIRHFQGISSPRLTHYVHDWQHFLQLRGDLRAVYLGTESRRLFVTPAWQPDARFDPRQRPWYKLAIATPQQVVWSEPYYDYANGELMMTVSRAVHDEERRLQGVFAADLVLNHLSGVMQGGEPAGSYQLIVDAKGALIATPDTSRLLHNMDHPAWLPRLSGESGAFLDEASHLYVAYHRLSHANWVLISVMPESRIRAAMAQAQQNLLLMIGLACLLYLVVALLWSRDLRRMADELRRLVQAARTPSGAVPGERLREFSHVYAELAAVGADYRTARLQADLDALTGLYNRRYFDRQLASLLERSIPFYLGMVDLDDFKCINDTFGHNTGDIVLRRVAQTGQALFGQHGWFCRYGGEELVVILLVQDSVLAHELLDDLRLEVELLHWREPGLMVTLSGGLVRVQGGSVESCLQRVDELVYASKHGGKNRITSEPPQAERVQGASA
ncbi:GGDEF domain-containing protein [Aeromonas simiae]|uniref:GGDEF domain-containing protein n=1 Tax=Aeromonas simiae TaxID=218936 RepID=UPI00266C6308|nr:sensor domain-containing diguanylate cyclase [Aeromonas simiae]MDO2949700.1 diguanylate cyclase [Aeromonas simiae]MDO2953425.1 diguanylate cyclase [Aeromonas simiae]MDO2957011.1 diguanylate cyclase [Aeromonas simiae]